MVHTWSDESSIQLDGKSVLNTPLYETNYGNTYKSNVSYHFNPNVSKYHYGVRHPMKPFRLLLTDHLVIAYKLYEQMDLYQPRSATEDELKQFHSDDYITFLKNVTPENSNKFIQDLRKFNIGDDCPVFEGIFDYSSYYAGASLDASRKLINGQSDIAINWSGGLHHAKNQSPVDSVMLMTLCYPF